MKNKEEICFNECITEMFRRVGEKYPNKELTDQKDWYMKRNWTHEKEADYKKWLIKKIKKAYPYMRGRKLEMEAAMFLLTYGWTNQEIKNDNKDHSGSGKDASNRKRKTNSDRTKTV